MDTLTEKIREILAIELQIERDRVLPSASLRDELGMDSIAALNILFAAQETFGVEIPESEVAVIGTVADVEALVRARVRNAHGGKNGS